MINSMMRCTECGEMKDCGDTRPAICTDCAFGGAGSPHQAIADVLGAPLVTLGSTEEAVHLLETGLPPVEQDDV